MKNFMIKFFRFSKMFSSGNSKKAFTLVELLVSMSIFMVFLGIVSTSYMSIIHAQREANSIRKMYSEVRTFMETLAQDVRLGTLDYDCYETATDLTNVPLNHTCPSDVGLLGGTVDLIASDGTSAILALVNKERTEKIVYWFDSTHRRIKLKRYISVLQDSDWMPAPGFESNASGADDYGFRTLLSDDLDVKYLSFAVYPALNPYVHFKESQFQFQPKVTIFLGVENAAAKNLPPFTLNLQTTLSSRVYSRK